MEEYYTYLSMCKDLLQQLNELENLQIAMSKVSKYILNNRKFKETKKLEIKDLECEIAQLKTILLQLDFNDEQTIKTFGNISMKIKKLMHKHRTMVETLKIEDFKINSALDEKNKTKEKIYFKSRSVEDIFNLVFSELSSLSDLPKGSLIDNILRELCLYIKEKITIVLYNIKLKRGINYEDVYKDISVLQSILESIFIFNDKKSTLNSDQELMLQEFFYQFYNLLINKNNTSINEELGNTCNFLYENLLTIYGLSKPDNLIILYNEEEKISSSRIKKVRN